MNSSLFKDRADAGKKLGLALTEYKKNPKAIVIALPRGGVVVGFKVAKELMLPLDIISPRKIGAPFNPELAIGAITETGEGIFSERLIEEFAIPSSYIQKAVAEEKKEAQRRLDLYRRGRAPRNVKGKIVILVDDGIATGSTMFAAIKTLQKESVEKLIVAVPVSPPDTFKRIEQTVDVAISLHTPTSFYSVGQFYATFDQTTDDQVIQLLSL